MRCKRLFWCFLVCSVVFWFNAYAAGSESGDKSSGRGIVQILYPDEKQPKVVSVILDNSSSMVRKDGGDREYTTRWIEADYTVKALAAMMDSQDMLRLYIMSGYRGDRSSSYSDPGRFNIGTEKDNTIQEISQYLENMTFSNLTYFQGVTRAARDMESDLAAGKDCWIVILTDGSFYRPEKMDAAKLTEELYKITAPGAYGRGRIRVAYIPVGDESEVVRIAEDVGNGIYVANVADTGQEGVILKKVTDTINRIYGRVRLEETIEEKYLPVEQGSVRFNFDIPLERLIVFMQQSGSEENYADFDSRLRALETEGSSAGDGRAEIIIGPPSVPAFLSLSDQADFEGRRKLPSYEDGTPGYDSALAKYKDLQGRMMSYIKNEEMLGSFSEQSLSIPINSDKPPDVEVYYQPAVKVGIEYIQNGKPVEHTKECLETMNQPDHVERCLREGEVTVRLKLMDENGNELPNIDSGLLRKDKFQAALNSVDDRLLQQMELTGTDYEFTGTIQEQDYKIELTTPWDKQDTGAVIVQERLKNLDISLDGTNGIWMNGLEDGANLIRVRINEDGLIPSWDIIQKMTVECTCSSERLDIEPVESAEQGVWLFRPVPKNPNDHHIEEETEIHIMASRPYYVRGADTEEQVGQTVIAESDFVLPISSYPEELSVSLESENAISVYSLLWPVLTQKKSLVYTCKDKLDGDQMKEVVNSDFVVEPEELEDCILLGKDGNLHIKRSPLKSLKWFFLDEESAAITFHSSYNLWNTQNEADVSLILSFKLIPAWVRFLVIAVLIFTFVWICACLFRSRTDLYIHPFKAVLEAEGVGMKYDMTLIRKYHIFNPFCNYAILRYVNGKDVEEQIIPTMQLKIRNNPHGQGYEINNYSDFQDSDRFKIDERAITADNRIFSNVKRFSIRDQNGVQLYMTIQN